MSGWWLRAVGAREEIVRPRRLVGASARPLNFTVRRPMWRRCALLLAAIAPVTAVADVPYLLSILKSPSTVSIPVAVSAVAEVKGTQILLKFHVTNISYEVLSFGVWELPWGHPNSISYIALTTDGRVLPNAAIFYNLCCDTLANVSISPSATLEGTYDLRQHLDQNSIPQDADLLVVWAWRVRTGDGGKVDRGIATGAVWIHTPK